MFRRRKRYIDVKKVTEKIIREYINYTKNRGKYTIVRDKETLKTNKPEMRKDYGKKGSITTINNYIRNIKVFFNFLLEQSYIKKDVVKNIKQFKNQRKAKEFITDSQFAELLRHINTIKFHEGRDHLCIMLLLDTGMRIGECLEIKVENVDMNYRSILLPAEDTKGKRDFYIKLM
ncbi:tyrosine-type recombinase/integrase [Clostridium botulinum]|uniref:tyrosine-type recombinase/integrase n=1 Tax=Clostridium botulinum TaxID=1491 RepID=UPI002AD486DD|nr:tyrosine-type recombinase/integrase [Clostridium botulinum]